MKEMQRLKEYQNKLNWNVYAQEIPMEGILICSWRISRTITSGNSVCNPGRILLVSKDFPRVHERINRRPQNGNKKAKKLQRMKGTLGIPDVSQYRLKAV